MLRQRQQKHYSLLDDEDDADVVGRKRRGGGTLCWCLMLVLVLVGAGVVYWHPDARSFAEKKTSSVRRVAVRGVHAVFGKKGRDSAGAASEDGAGARGRDPYSAAAGISDEGPNEPKWGSGEVIPVTYEPTPPTPRPTRRPTPAPPPTHHRPRRDATAAAAADVPTPAPTPAPTMRIGTLDIECKTFCVSSKQHPKLNAKFTRVDEGGVLVGRPPFFVQKEAGADGHVQYVSYVEHGITGRWILSSERARPRKGEPPGSVAHIDTWARKPCDAARLSPHAVWHVGGKPDPTFSLECMDSRHLRVNRPPEVVPYGDRVELYNGFEVPVTFLRTESLLQSVDAALGGKFRAADVAGYAGLDVGLSHTVQVAVGEFLKEHGGRHDFTIAAKVGGASFGFESTLAAIAALMKRLSVSYVDVLVLHGTACTNPSGCEGSWKESWKAMEKIYARGMAKALGVADFGVAQLKELRELAGVDVAIAQGWHNPLHPDRAGKQYCQEHDIWFQAVHPLGGNPPRSGQPQRSNAPTALLAHSVVKRIAAARSKTAAQVLLRWATQQKIGAIVGSRNRVRRHQNAAHDFDLTTAEVDALDNLADDL